MKFVLAPLFFALVAFLFQSNTASYQINSNAVEQLPTKTVAQQADYLTDFDESCFTSPEEYAIYLASSTEKTALDMFFPIETKMEIEVGKEFHEAQEYVYIEDKRTEKLRKMLKKLVKNASRKDELEYTIYLIEDPVINAWTVPGGSIYVSTGILDFAENDDELANIIGHEVGHNEKHHGTRQIQRNVPAMWFGDQVSVIVNVLSNLTIAFNQYQELESDQIGFDLSSAAGYKPLNGLEFWNRLAAQETQDFFDKLFRSHPYSENRYNCGKAYIEKKD